MNENGFKVNTDVKVKPRKKKGKRVIKNLMLFGTAVILVLAVLAIVFCFVVPVREVTILDYCIIENKNGITETDYYDENGRVIKKVAAELGIENVTTVYTYDKNGNILKEEGFLDGMLITTVNYTYTDSKLTKKENLAPDNKISSAVEYHYNPDGTVTMELIYDDKGEIVDQFNHTYEGGVRIATSRVHLSNNSTENVTYTYENGNLITEKQMGNTGEKTITYTYDSTGKILTRNVSGSDYAVYRYTYKTVKVPLFGK